MGKFDTYKETTDEYDVKTKTRLLEADEENSAIFYYATRFILDDHGHQEGYFC